MRVLLLYPPITHQAVYSRNFRRVKGAETSAYPPLGLMYLQAMLKRETDYATRLKDLTLPGARNFDLERELAEFKPDVVGMTAYTLCLFDVMDLARRIKAASPGTKIALGGPHISLYARETMNRKEVDFAIEGDGETPFLELLRALETGGGDVAEVPSLWWRDARGRTRNNPLLKVEKDLDKLPFPCRDDLPDEGYFNPFFSERRFATVATSRGCPFSCTFCDVTDKIFRARSAANILDEIAELVAQGIRSFFLVDDLFNITPGRVEEFCDGVLSRGLDITWIFRGRIDQITPAMLDKCKAAGCAHIIFGVEDYTDDGLKLIRKKISTSQALKTFEMTRSRGIKSTANFILGFPHHRSRQDLLGLSDFLKKLRPDYLQVGILIPFPGSRIYAEGVAKGIIDPGRWLAYVNNPGEVFEMPLWEEHLSLADLTDCYERVLKRFYLSPRQIWSRILELRSLSQFATYAKVGWATLRSGRFKAPDVPHPEELVPSTLARDAYYRSRGLYERMSGKLMADVGCGTGFFAGRFAKAGAAVVALDVSDGNARLAARLNVDSPVMALSGDAHALPLADGSLDAVFCSGVVEHFERPEDFFAEAHRVLKPGGTLLLTVDVRPKLTYRLYRLSFLFDRLYDPSHPMLHKRTVISDERCLEFIDPQKMERALAPLFTPEYAERLCGLNFNLVHGSIVIVNRIYQMLSGGMLDGDNYAEQMRIIDRPLFRFYRKLLPIIRFVAHPRLMTFDAIYHFQILSKRRP